MFVKLRKRIFWGIFWVVFVFVFITSAVSYVTIAEYIFSSQRNRTVKNAESGVLGCSSYINAVMGFVSSMATHSDIVEVLQGDVVFDVTQHLDRLYNYSVKVDGAMLYGTNGYFRCSAGVGSAPTFEELLQSPDIKEFFASPQKSFVSMRKQAVAQVYDKVYYPSQNGVVSCMHKVYGNNGEVIGLLEADILPRTLVSAELNYTSFDTTATTLLFNGEGVFANDQFAYYIGERNGVTADKQFYAVYLPVNDNVNLAMFVSLAELYKKALVLAFVFLAIDAVLVSACSLVVFQIRDSVVGPLESLMRRMKTEQIY